MREEIRYWRTQALQAVDEEPPPLILDIYLDTSELTRDHQILVLADDHLRLNRVDMLTESNYPVERILLERWTLRLRSGTKSAKKKDICKANKSDIVTLCLTLRSTSRTCINDRSCSSVHCTHSFDCYLHMSCIDDSESMDSLIIYVLDIDYRHQRTFQTMRYH